MAPWEDLGLFVALAVNSIGSAAIVVGAFFLHQWKENARILRPNRPGSHRGSIFLPPNDLFGMREPTVLEKNGMRPMLYVLLLKFTLFLWLCICLSSVVIVACCATDSFVNTYRMEQDPELCGTLGPSGCSDAPFCSVVVVSHATSETSTNGTTNHSFPTSTSSSTAVNGSQAAGGAVFLCRPAPRTGVFDFGVQNLTPNNWRWYFFGAAVALVVLPMVYVVRSYAEVVRGAIRFAHTAPAFKGLDYGAMSTVGARTVLVGGLPNDAACLASPEAFMAYLSADTHTKKEVLKVRLPHKKMLESVKGFLRKLNPAKLLGHHKKKHTADAGGAGGEEEARKETQEKEQPAPAIVVSPSHEPFREDATPSPSNSAFTSPAAPDGAAFPMPMLGGSYDAGKANLSENTPPLSHRGETFGARCRRRRASLSTGGKTLDPGGSGPASLPPPPQQQRRKRQEPLGPPIDLSMPSWRIAAVSGIEPSIIAVQECPSGLLQLIAEEKDVLQSLAGSMAAEQRETDPTKKPLTRRLIPKLWKKVPAVQYDLDCLKEVREKLEPLLAKRDTQPLAGAAFFTFDRASSAAAFVRQFNQEQGAISSARAEVMGPRENVLWMNVGVAAPQRTGRALVTAAVFTGLVIGWSIPVGFFGSLENWRDIPGMRSIIDGLPLTVSGALSAYLPVLVLSLFNLTLPAILRYFGLFGGAKTKDERHHSVLVMCAVFSVVTGVFVQAVLLGGTDRVRVVIDSPSQENFFALILAIASPTTGYWFTFLVSAGSIQMLVHLLHVWPMIKVRLLGPLADAQQESYDRLFEPRVWNYPFLTGRHIFFVAIGLVFHGTIPFLQPFALAYCATAYVVRRAVILDAVKPDTRPIINYGFVLTGSHCVLAMHTVASIINVVVAGVRAGVETMGAPVLATISLAGSVYLHLYLRRVLRPIVDPTPEMIAIIEADTDALGLPREELEDTMPYVPDYSTYAIDYDAVSRKEHEELATVDKRWPKPGAELASDDPATFLCFGPAAAKQQQVEHLFGRVHELEEENDRLRAFHTIALDRANFLASGGCNPAEFEPQEVAAALAKRHRSKSRRRSTSQHL